jgi:hypothetical protein
MVDAIAITEAITDLNEAHRRFQIVPTNDPQFFWEWRSELPELLEAEKVGLDRLRDRYLYYAADGSITEGTVNLILVSPLLELLGLFDPPFKVKGEHFVRMAIANDDVMLRGRIDALVIQDRLWIALVEAKHFGFSVLQAIPQTLAYMVANPQDSPGFALITTGEDYLFLKLAVRDGRMYGQSYKFTLLSDENNNLYRVARILKGIAVQLQG